MRTTVDIDPHLLKRLRDEADERGVPFKQYLMSVLQRGLDTRHAPRRHYRCPVHALGAPLGGMDVEKALRVAERLQDERTARRARTQE
jgi:hypothetical protein